MCGFFFEYAMATDHNQQKSHNINRREKNSIFSFETYISFQRAVEKKKIKQFVKLVIYL